MFNLHDFLMKGFLDAVGNKPDYWIILNATGWMEKGVFAEDDLAVISDAIDKKNTPPAEPVPEDIGETPIPADSLDPMMGVADK